MNDAVRRAAGALVDDLRGVFGARLQSLLVYGAHASGADVSDASHPRQEPIHTLALVDRVALADLAACAGLAAAWRRRGLATPLIVPADEFVRSLDVFPLEYGEIIARHAVVEGSSPFEGLGVKADDVRRACEVQAKSHLLHLREGYIEAGGRQSAVAQLVARSATPFAVLLANVLRLLAADASSHEAMARHSKSAIGLSAGVVAGVLALARAPEPAAADAASLFPAYLEAVERLARFLDRWQ